MNGNHGSHKLDVKVDSEDNLPDVTPEPASSLPRVLFVGREDVFVRILAAWLAEKGWAVSTLPGYREALAGWAPVRADVIVGDLEGTDIDGLEFAGRLAVRPDAPPVVLSSHVPGVRSWRPEFLTQLGVADVILRPCHLSDAERVVAWAAGKGL